jgi:hypothetical protein
MSKTSTFQALEGCGFRTWVIAAATAFAVSLAAATPGTAATHHKTKAAPALAQTHEYGPTSEGDPPPGMTAGQVGHRINPTLPGGNGFGPPDPASCGGFNC